MKPTETIKGKLRLLFIPCLENNFRPKFLAGRFVVYYIIILAALKIIGIFSIICLPKTIFFADISNYTLIELTNRDREALGISSLREDPRLINAAYLKAKDMLEKGYFSHQSPAGRSSWDWIKEMDYDYQYAGENLAIGFLDAEEIYRAWYNSPDHKANLLNPLYQEIGVAVLKGDFQGSETYVVVELFGSMKEKKIVQTTSVIEKPVSENEVINLSPTPLAESPKPEETPAPPERTEEVITENKEMTKEVAEEKEKPIVKGAVSGTEGQKTSFLFNLSRFLANNYNDIVQFIISLSLLLITLSLLINVFIKFDIQFGDLIARASLFLIILALFVFFDKEFLLRLIPHQLNIY